MICADTHWTGCNKAVNVLIHIGPPEVLGEHIPGPQVEISEPIAACQNRGVCKLLGGSPDMC